MKIGTIIQWASNTIPSDWLLCDGSAVSRTTYADLFAVIGTQFGTGDGSTTFNLPDLRGKVGVGRNSNDTDFDTIGETGGEKTHTLTVDEIPSHSHSIPEYAQEIYNPQGGTSAKGTGNTADWSVNTGLTGGNQPHNIMQPYIVLNYIIKATQPDTIKISELNEITTLDDDDLIPVVDTSADETKKITYANLKAQIINEIS